MQSHVAASVTVLSFFKGSRNSATKFFTDGGYRLGTGTQPIIVNISHKGQESHHCILAVEGFLPHIYKVSLSYCYICSLPTVFPYDEVQPVAWSLELWHIVMSLDKSGRAKTGKNMTQLADVENAFPHSYFTSLRENL